MANMLIPVEERHLTPAQVDQIDRRRRRGQLLLVVGYQTCIVGTIVTMWSGQDFTYSPGWVHPLGYWNVFLYLVAIVCFVAGIRLRRGMTEFFSY